MAKEGTGSGKGDWKSNIQAKHAGALQLQQDSWNGFFILSHTSSAFEKEERRAIETWRGLEIHGVEYVIILQQIQDTCPCTCGRYQPSSSSQFPAIPSP